MKGSFRQSMSWLHTWAGLVLGWVLYFVFVTGSVGYFDTEIDRWMQPEIVFNDGSIGQVEMLSQAEKRLTLVAPNAVEWFVEFPSDREPFLAVWWLSAPNPETGEQGEWQHENIDVATGEPMVARETGGGQLLYRMHYRLHYMPAVIAYWLVSLCSMFMLVALITGVVIHKKIFKDFFTFRPSKKQRSWLDIHNVLSVLPLPFHLMITYSGLLLLMSVSMPLVISASYGSGEDGEQQFFDEIFAEHEKTKAGVSAESVSMITVLPAVKLRWADSELAYISVENRGDLNAQIIVGKKDVEGIADESPQLAFSAVSGEPQDEQGEPNKGLGAVQFYEVMTHLHEGLFAGPVLRWLYFLSGLMGAGMIATGMVLWAVKRRERAVKRGRESFGLRLVEVLNVGTVMGLPIGIAAYFMANRLIPADAAGREGMEVLVLFVVWGLLLLYPLLRAGLVRVRKKKSVMIEQAQRSTGRVWVEILWLGAASYGFVPVLNMLTSDKHLVSSALEGDWAMVGFDVTLLAFSGGFALAASIMSAPKYRLKFGGVPSVSTSMAGRVSP